MRRTAIALIMCAVMVLVALVPLASGGEYVIVKGPRGPRASAMTWTYEPLDYGVWTAKIDNNGLRWLVLDVYDNTSGALEQLLHQRIRFAAYGAYPSGTVYSEPVMMANGGKYQITATPNGPRQSYAVISDQFAANKSPIALFNYTVNYLVVNVDASASYDPDIDGAIMDYVWEWGDGATGSGVTTSHTYAAAGIYTITLTVVDNLGSTGTVTHDVTVIEPPNEPPVALFTVLTNYLVVDVDGKDSYDPDGTIVEYAWSWGDGSANDVSALSTAQHTYAMGGTYTITLTVTDNDGATGSTSQDVTVEPYVDQPPVAAFTYVAQYLVVSFDAMTSSDDNGITNYAWDFGDGIIGAGAQITHEYAASGTYTVSLTVTDTIGQTGTTSKEVTVVANQPPVAQFTVTTNYLEVTVDGSGSYDPDGIIASYAWDFGDGATATGPTATHTYGMDGTYTITLTVADAMGLTDDATDVVTVHHQPIPPVAAFSVQTNFLEVTVDGSTSSDPDGAVVSYAWDFGDGGSATGPTAVHTYAMDGTYQITLVVTDNEGLTGTTSKPVTVSAEPIPPTAVISVTTSWLTVDVDGSGSSDPDGVVVAWNWDFGDGAVASGATASHTYATDGTYTITLVVTDDDGLTGTATESVSVVHEPMNPIASFTVVTSFLVVDVNAGASYDPDGTITSYAWNFGDGATATGVTASHEYAAEGTYTITLIVTDNDGLTGTDSKPVQVSAEPIPPTAAFTWTAVYEVVSFDGSGSSDSDGSVVAWAWNFGDGGSGSGKTATHTYAASGTYSVTLTVTDDDGLTGTVTHSVAVTFNNPPVASFTVTKDYLQIFVDASGSSDDIGIASYAWSYGDGGSGSGVMDSHTYAAAGTYTVSLTVADIGGKSTTTSKSVTVVQNTPPTAVITLVSTSDLTVTLSGSASSDDSGIASYAWNFGDGSTDSGVSVTHTYAADGTYTVTLVVTDDHGLTGTATLPVTVAGPDSPPTAAFTYTVDGLTVNVNAGTSTDDHGIVGYSWDWGDGTTGSGVTATHTYSITVMSAFVGAANVGIEQAPIPPYYVAGYTYGPGNVKLPGCTLSIKNMRTGAVNASSSDPATAFFRFDLHTMAGDFVIGDLINITATKDVMIGWNESAVPATGSFLSMNVYLSAPGPAPIVKTITLTVTDTKGQTDSVSHDVTLVAPNAPPVASFTATPTYLVVQVDASGSTDSDGSIMSYAWTFGDGGVATGKTASHTYATDGTYTITLTVTDDDGASDSDSKPVTVAHQPIPPTAAFTWSANYEIVSFDGSGSSDSDGTVMAWAWSFGDGGSGSGKTVSHTYAAGGTYSVTLTVTDNEALTGAVTHSVAVQFNAPPLAAFTVTKDYLQVFVDASGSSDDIGIASYAWSYGDGGSGSGVMDSHTYAAAGTYTVSLTVADIGGKSTTTSKSVTVVQNTPPTAVISVVSIVDLTASLSGSGSTDDAPIAGYAWDFGDGNLGSGVGVTHTYGAGGTYSVSLIVTDDHGLTASASMPITVSEPVPVSEKTYRMYDMFNVPWGWWWGPRWSFYLTDMIISNEPGAYVQYFLPLKVGASSMQGLVYAPYRFSFDENNQTGLNINKPEFMPVLGPDVAGAEANIDIAFQYIEPTTWSNYWLPTWGTDPTWTLPTDWIFRSGADGYDLGTVYTVDMNREAAEQWMNMPQAADPAVWWAANQVSYKENWTNWIKYEGNTRLDIFCGYEWPYDINGGTWMKLAEQPDGTLTLQIGHIALGYEILMTRWFVETNLLTGLEVYMEDFTLSATYGETMADVDSDFVAQYSLHAVKANKTVDSPAWVWEPAKIDYITKLGRPSDYAPYARLGYQSWNAVDPYFGLKVPYEQTPNWFNLSANEKLTIEAPTGTVPGYRGIGVTEDDIYYMATTGDTSVLPKVTGTIDLGYTRTGPNETTDVELSPFWNAATKTLTLVGPMNFDNFRHKTGTTDPVPSPVPAGGNPLYHGAPWIEFNVITTAAANSAPGTDVTVAGTAGAGITESVSVLAALALASAVVLYVAVRRRREE